MINVRNWFVNYFYCSVIFCIIIGSKHKHLVHCGLHRPIVQNKSPVSQTSMRIYSISFDIGRKKPANIIFFVHKHQRSILITVGMIIHEIPAKKESSVFARPHKIIPFVCHGIIIQPYRHHYLLLRYSK